MTSIRLDMTMSLDGFIAGPDDRPGQELGRGGFRLFNWLDDRNQPGPNGEVYADSMATGAIIAGRRTLELAGRLHQPGRRAHTYSKVDPEYTCTCRGGYGPGS